jgi:hypothetical protein
MKYFIVFCSVISFAKLSFSQCASAGNDSIFQICRNKPFNLDSLLSDSASLNGNWFNPAGNAITNANIISSNIPGQYVYTYVVQDSVCGTIDSAFFLINVLVWCETGGIEETSSSNLTIFPNPTSNGVFTLSKEVDYVIEDASGKRIPVIHLPGLYFIVVGETRYKLINL